MTTSDAPVTALHPPITPIRVGVVGTGLIGRSHLSGMAGRPDTVIAAICEPRAEAADAGVLEVTSRGGAAPVVEADWDRFIAVTAAEQRLDAVVLFTPHALHFAQARAALEAGVDVLLEKPMVTDAAEAEELIRTRHRTGRLLVVAFNGSLSPRVRAAAAMIRAGELGALLNVNAYVWQDWISHSRGTWRTVPEISGGGFLFDTGAHMLNTVCDLAGEDVAEVAAFLETDGEAVDVRGAVLARLASGALITMNGCGRAIPSLGSDIHLFLERATLRTGIWGERLEIQRAGSMELRPVRSVQSKSVWEQFLDVRSGREANPSPPEIGLRMARLWDAIRESSVRGGAMVRPVRDAEAVA
jgi:predicted dehydrogenase